jgi:general secretion pathway protein H
MGLIYIKNQGFSLLELLVVAFMLGVIISFVGLAVGDNKQQLLRQEARQLQALLQAVREQAIFNQQNWAVGFDDGSYAFYQFINDWQLVTTKPFTTRKFSPYIQIDLWIEGRIVSGQQPQILIFANGEVTPYQLELGYRDTDLKISLNGDLFGNIDMEYAL